VQLAIGKFLGRLTFILLRNRKKVALSNIKRVFIDFSDEKIRTIARSNFEKLGINVIEFLLMPFIKDREIPERFTVEGKEFFEEALLKGKGAIALGFHFGNWEVTGIVSKLLGHNIVALARPLKKQVLLNNFLNNLRRSTGLTIIVNENTGKEVMKLLKENKIVAILGDQREKSSRGVFVEFFGTKVPTSKGTTMIAMKTGAPVIPVYAIRKGFLRYTFVCGNPLKMERTGNIGELIEKNTRKINAFLETIIKQYPDEWFWVHKRWRKSRRNRNQQSTETKK
jgi:KDO2-lipid IV(A) lauroyltransferase